MNLLSIYKSYYPENGGIQNVIQNLSENFVEMGHIAKVICLTDKEMIDFETLNGVEVFRIRDNSFKHFMDYSIHFFTFFEDHSHLFDEANIINIHSYHSLFSWQLIRFLNRKGYGEKIIFTPHYEGIGFTPIKHVLHKVYRVAANSSFTLPKKIVCVSDFEKNNLCKKFCIPSSKICVIPNGIRYDIPNKLVLKKVNGNKIKLLYVGRIEEKKGIQYALKAIKYFMDTYPLDIEFNIVGTGNFLDKLKNIAQNYGLNNIHFLGRVTDEELDTIYLSSDIFLLLSKSEAYGIVVAEALAHSLIVITSRSTALVEFLSENGCFGIDYPPDHIQLAELIYKLATEEISIGPFSSKISQWEDVADKYLLVYEDLLSN